ncbi:hypothetical protein KKF69_05410 [Patescibacteria group bacterium]|nr:hypothetical protein [Patescibacteria group bacterium]
MKLLSFLSKKIIHQSRFDRDQLRFNQDSARIIRNLKANQEQTEALIQTGRQQFKKLEELGLKIPIAVL